MRGRHKLAEALMLTAVCCLPIFAGQNPSLVPPHAIPVIRGDYPDPSVVRVEGDYYAVATSADFVPAFPILHSRDLVHWDLAGNVFPEWPAWASGDFWGPDISHVGSTFYVYYAARKRGAGLCVAVATSSSPTGPYQDHGPLVCQPDGSIDPQDFVDVDGQRYLVWKEDSNSVHRPTHIFIRQLSSDGLKLVGKGPDLSRLPPALPGSTGQPGDLIWNQLPWEGEIVEAPYMIRHEGLYYLFYSGNWCCNPGCSYALGVARSRNVLGPFEKDPANPILASNQVVKCPGHEGMIETAQNEWYALYHAYRIADGEMIGREWGLDRVDWKGGWPVINQGDGPTPSARGTHPLVFDGSDEFGSIANPAWLHRTVAFTASRSARAGWLRVPLEPDPGQVLVQTARGRRYAFSTRIEFGPHADETAGLIAYGDAQNYLRLAVTLDTRRASAQRCLEVQERRHNTPAVLATSMLPARGAVELRLTIDGRAVRAFYRLASGSWQPLGEEWDGYFTATWETGLRIGIFAAGANPHHFADFDWFHVEGQD